MPITIDTLDVVEQDAVDSMRSRFPASDLGPRGFRGLIARSVAWTVYALLQAFARVDRDAVPTDDTGKEGLDRWAIALGLDNGDGGYGRRKADTAAGGVGTITGTGGTVYTAGLQLTASDGTTIVKLDGNVTLPGGGSASGSFSAVTAGAVGNLDVGEVLTWISPPAGSNPTVTLTTNLSGGLDEEANGALLVREQDKLRAPPKGGAEPDYRAWALVDGVLTVHVYPHRSGTGSVDLVVVGTGSGTARIPAASVKTAAQAAVDAARPTAMSAATVHLPYYSGSKHLVRVRPKESSSKYAPDWDDTAAAYTVDTYTGGSPATLKLNTLAPASLKNAVDAGSKPRLQVTATSGPEVAVLVRGTAWADAGGKTTLTLENPLPTGWVAPVATDEVYAGSGMVKPIGDAVLAYVNALGPSRASGFGSTVSTWEDTISVFRVAQTALDATDGSTKVASNLLGTPTIDGVATDLQAQDASGNPPELLAASYVLVTKSTL